MKMNLVEKLNHRAFTLVEVIVTILAAAIVGVIFINFMGTAMSKSVRPVEMVQGEALAEATLERIISKYVFRLNQNEITALGLIKADIDSKTVYGVNVTAAYIDFDTNGNEISDSNKYRTLKVTVAATGNDLVTLLTRSRKTNSPAVPF